MPLGGFMSTRYPEKGPRNYEPELSWLEPVEFDLAAGLDPTALPAPGEFRHCLEFVPPLELDCSSGDINPETPKRD
jgi:hypothetical protein